MAAGTFGKGYSYKARRVIDIHGCSRPVSIVAQNATLVTAGGLKFGSFNPVTGEPHTPSMPFYDADYAADLGYMIRLTNNKEVTITGSLELDGNCESMQIGGLWGDTGRQALAYGVYCAANAQLNISDLVTHHHCLDGLYVGQNTGYDATVPTPVTLTGITAEYNCRQGLSLTGGNGFTVRDCKFNYTGTVMFASALSAGVDIEAELGKVRNASFVNCEFIDNAGCAMVADSGDIADISFTDCTFSGYQGEAVWPKKPRMTFTGCTINGALVNAYGSTTVPSDSTTFTGCTFTDETLQLHGPSPYRLIDTVNYPGVTFNDCSFTSVAGRYSDFRNAKLNDCTFIQRAGTESLQPDKFQVILLWGSIVNNLTVNDEVSNQPANGYFVGLSGTTMNGVNTINSSGVIKWKSWDGTGYTGFYVG